MTKQQILQLIDRKIKQYPYEDDDTGMDLHSEHNKFRATLQELRKEIEEMEDDTIKTIDEMIEELDFDDQREKEMLEELKERLHTNK